MKRFALLAVMTVLAALPLLAQRPDLTGLSFCIDPGHGGNNPANDRLVIPDPGIEFWESESNFRKALLLDTLLRAKGATVILTRYTNTYPNDNDEPTLAQRVATANANNVSWFHSIHSNAFNGVTNYTLLLVRENRSVPGTPQWPQAQVMSEIISPRIQGKLRTTAAYTRLDYTFLGYSLGVLSGLNMPGELSEGSFHDVFPETRRLMNNHYRKMEAHALREAILQYYTVPADTSGIVAGIQTEIGLGRPINNTRVRLLPEDRVYMGDMYNNGFFLFDNLLPGQKTIRFETPNYTVDSVRVTVARGGTHFADRQLESMLPPTIVTSVPVRGDTLFSANQNVVLQFSKVMDTASVRRAFSITPAAAGRLLWSQNNTRLDFDPDAVLPFFVNFTVRVDTSARSLGGQMLDGDGNGVPGDPYVLTFRTRDVDAFAPVITSSWPSPGAVVSAPTTIVNITFDERLNPATVTQTNVSAQRIGGSVLPREVQYWEMGTRGGINIYLQAPLEPGAQYRVRVSGVTDLVGNPIPNTSPVIWQFSTGPGAFTTDPIERFDSALVSWLPPGGSSSTVGIDSASFGFAASPVLPGVPDNVGSGRLRWDWNTGASSWLLREELVTGPGRARIFRRASGLLSAAVFGDGSMSQIRFCVQDSVEAFPNGTPTNREVSRWFPLDWIGWRVITWDLANDTVGSWVGNGRLEGDLRFDSFQLRYLPGTSYERGSAWIDQLEIGTRVPTAVGEGSDAVPGELALEQNYPNPFNPATVVRFSVRSEQWVTLTVYDVLGRRVATLVDEAVPAGTHAVRWDAAGMASGMYTYRLEAGGAVLTKKMLLMK